MNNTTADQHLQLKKKILSEMIFDESPKATIKRQIRRQIRFNFESEESFNTSFETAYNKFTKELLK